MPTNVFLSYAGEDQEIAERLREALERSGVEVWSARHIPVGASLASEIYGAISSSQVVILVLSKAAMESEWVRREIYTAVAHEELGGEKRILPVLIDDVEPPFFLRNYARLDLRGQRNFEEAVDSIVKAIKHPAESALKGLDLEVARRSLELEEMELHAEMAQHEHKNYSRTSLYFPASAVLVIVTAVVATTALLLYGETIVVPLWPNLLVSMLFGLVGFLLGRQGRSE